MTHCIRSVDQPSLWQGGQHEFNETSLTLPHLRPQYFADRGPGSESMSQFAAPATCPPGTKLWFLHLGSLIADEGFLLAGAGAATAAK